jgi:hypothetical protein
MKYVATAVPTLLLPGRFLDAHAAQRPPCRIS